MPDDTAWHPVDDLPDMAFDHAIIADRAQQRLQAKLSYTNIGFALAPVSFTLAELGRIYAAALGHDVDLTNLQRILTRRGMLEPTGTTAPPGPAGGRPAAMYRFSVGEFRVTDPFAAFRPPARLAALQVRAAVPGHQERVDHRRDAGWASTPRMVPVVGGAVTIESAAVAPTDAGSVPGATRIPSPQAISAPAERPADHVSSIGQPRAARTRQAPSAVSTPTMMPSQQNSARPTKW